MTLPLPPLQMPTLQSTEFLIEHLFSQPWSLAQIKGFPWIEYTNNMGRYMDSARWFFGDALNQVDVEHAGEQIPMYPVRINPIQSTCLKHGYALYGDVPDDGRPLVTPKFIPNRNEDKELTDSLNDQMTFLWWENFGRAIQSQQSILTQIYGGCVYGLRYMPWDRSRRFPIRIEKHSPEQFLGIPMWGDEYRLQEAWIVRPIRMEHAEQYGYHVDSLYHPVHWIEHWTLDHYTVQINEQPVDATINGVRIPPEGPNVYGFIPFVYIPHIRIASYYGINNIDHLKGLVTEYNLRFADYGDAVNQDAHPYVWWSDVDGLPHAERITPELRGLDLGDTTGFTGNESKPQIGVLNKPTASTAMKELLQELMSQYRRDANMPPVADGEDEGSQRSSLTLVTRFWPLISHISAERHFMGDGLNWLTTMILEMMNQWHIGDIPDKAMELRFRQDWADILPSDKETHVNQLINRFTQNYGAPESLLDEIGVEDIDGEISKMKDWVTFLEEAKANALVKAQAALNPQMAAPGNGPDNKTSKSK